MQIECETCNKVNRIPHKKQKLTTRGFNTEGCIWSSEQMTVYLCNRCGEIIATEDDLRKQR